MAISVINAIKDNSGDFLVGADKCVGITGFQEKVPVRAVSVKPHGTPTAGVVTVAFVAQQNKTYLFEVDGYNKDGVLVTLPFSYKSPSSGATSASIAAAIDTIITNSEIGGQFASIVVNGSNELVLTGTTAYPLINFKNPYKDTNMTVTNSTLGVAAIGLGKDLKAQYQFSDKTESAKFVDTDYYTEVIIESQSSSQERTSTAATKLNTTYKLFVNATNPTSAGSNPVALNRDFLLAADTFGSTKTIGSIVALAQGYRMIVQSPATTTAAITVTTGAIALSGGAATFSTLGARQGDVLVLASAGGTAFTSQVRTTLLGFTSATAATGDNVTAQSAVVFKLVSLRPIL